jgi:hypothetical protein
MPSRNSLLAFLVVPLYGRIIQEQLNGSLDKTKKYLLAMGLTA